MAPVNREQPGTTRRDFLRGSAFAVLAALKQPERLLRDSGIQPLRNRPSDTDCRGGSFEGSIKPGDVLADIGNPVAGLSRRANSTFSVRVDSISESGVSVVCFYRRPGQTDVFSSAAEIPYGHSVVPFEGPAAGMVIAAERRGASARLSIRPFNYVEGLGQVGEVVSSSPRDLTEVGKKSQFDWKMGSRTIFSLRLLDGTGVDIFAKPEQGKLFMFVGRNLIVRQPSQEGSAHFQVSLVQGGEPILPDIPLKLKILELEPTPLEIWVEKPGSGQRFGFRVEFAEGLAGYTLERLQ